jgi:PAS domain S-box-containing protein
VTAKHRQPALRRAASRELVDLRLRLAEAEELLRAIRGGEVDAVVVAGKKGRQVFTLRGVDHAYRMLIESMNEGALTLTADTVILYANRCFARMVKCPLEQAIGSSFDRFLSTEDRGTLRTRLRRIDKSGSKIQLLMLATDGAQLPVQASLRPLARNELNRATIGMVVTDLTDSRRNEEMLREWSHRLVQVQEAERGRVALELHDHITQHLCGILVRCQTLADQLSVRDGPSMMEALKLRVMLGQTAKEVERISRNLRPGVLHDLGLVPVLRSTSAEFAKRTGVSLKLVCVTLTVRLPPDTELSLYRILQEALKNVELHARARQVYVRLTKRRDVVQLTIKDDGIGFDTEHLPVRRGGIGGLGLLAMRERALSSGGVLTVKSTVQLGTEIEARIPCLKAHCNELI